MICGDGRHRYAIKKLSPGLYNNDGPQIFACGVIDLAMEAKYLSVLQHPHIIKLRAMANVNLCSKDFFIILDRLNFTLTNQVEIWKAEISSSSCFDPNAKRSKKKKIESFCKRLVAARDICSAVNHLHENK